MVSFKQCLLLTLPHQIVLICQLHDLVTVALAVDYQRGSSANSSAVVPEVTSARVAVHGETFARRHRRQANAWTAR